MMKVAVCQSCGSIADKQSDVVLNGQDDLYSCPVCKGEWKPISKDSLPVQFEVVIKKRFADLRKMGIKTIMITGDNPLTAGAIAAEAGVDDFIHVRSNLLETLRNFNVRLGIS